MKIITAFAFVTSAVVLTPTPALATNTVCNRIAQNCANEAAGDPEAFNACWADQGEPVCPQPTQDPVPVEHNGVLYYMSAPLYRCFGFIDCNIPIQNPTGPQEPPTIDGA